MRRILLSLAPGFLLAALSLPMPAQSIINFGGNDTNANNTYPTGINDSGEVVGDGSTQGFLYDAGARTNLGTLGGPYSFATGINDSGEIVGYSQSGTAELAFTYSNSTMTRLGTLGGSESVGNAINNSGQVTGDSLTSSGSEMAFLYSNGVMTNLGALGGAESVGNAINSSGEVTGFYIKNNVTEPFLYASGKMTSLGNDGMSGVEGLGINDSGEIVGMGVTAAYHNNSFVYSGGVFTNIGTLEGGNDTEAMAINNAGEVVGLAYTSFGGVAFEYSATGGIQDLNVLYASLLVSGETSQQGFTKLTTAEAVNNEGQITGQGLYWNGTTSTVEAFILTPVAVPEPSSLTLLSLVGVTLLATYRIRRPA